MPERQTNPVDEAAQCSRSTRFADDTTMSALDHPPVLLIPDEVASLLRTTRTAIYAMHARGQLPGVVRIGRRLLFRRDVLIDWLNQKHAPSPKESRR